MPLARLTCLGHHSALTRNTPLLRVLGAWTLLLSIASPTAAERLPLKLYTTSDGLPHDAINSIVRDSRGFLWFCTADGLSRFDGYAFVNFGTEHGLPPGSIVDLLETRRGEYWVASEGGLVRFNPRGRPVRHGAEGDTAGQSGRMFGVVSTPDTDRRARFITVLHEDAHGTIWVGTYKGLYRLEGSRDDPSLRVVDIGLPHRFQEQQHIADVEEAYGSLWIATPYGLYRRWPDGSTARYGSSDGLPAQYLSNLLEDHGGRLWVGSRDNGFFRVTADASRRPPAVDFAISEGGGLPNRWVFQMFETADHRLWAATARGVLLVEGDRTNPGARRPYTTGNGLSAPDIAALSEDVSGNLWLATGSAGAMKWARDGFTSYGDLDGIEMVNAIFEDSAGDVCFKGRVWGDAQTSLSNGGARNLLRQPVLLDRFGCFDGSRFDWFTLDAVVHWGWVLEQVTLRAENGNWWAGSAQGLFHFPPAARFAALKTSRPLAVYTTADGLAANDVFRLFEDGRGRIWVSTISSVTRGLSRWDPNTGRLADLAGAAGLPSMQEHLPRSFGEDRAGNVWIGFNIGVARYRDGTFIFFDADDGLPPGPIMNIHLDRSGRLWLASSRSGLIRVDEASAPRPAFVSYTTAQGLSSNDIAAITEDGEGHLYVGGGRGLDRLDPETGRVKHFTSADGLPPGTLKAAFRDRRGVLWFGMSDGLARHAPRPEKAAAVPPIWISGLRIRGLPQLVSAVGEQDMRLPDLAPDRSQLQIDFVSLGFGTGDVLRYQYRLEGADAGWSSLDGQRSVTYASLPPGSYRFAVRAANSDGLLSAQPASLRFTVLRPVWQRWWALLLAALSLGAMVQGVYRYRVARLLEMADMRTRIATDLHDDIGANLTRIALLSEVARRQDPEAPLASIAQIARESVGSMSDIVWAINPARDSLLDLTRRMRQHAEEVFTLRGIELRFDAPVQGGVKLDVHVRRDVLLIFKEAVNNAARHSRCSRVDIALRFERSHLVLTVADDGVGFDGSTESDGQGLSSMTRRAHRLRGNLTIASDGGRGTTVRLHLPA